VEHAIVALRGAIEHSPDLIEVRLDFMERVAGLERFRAVTALPLIATIRRGSEGGNFKGSEEDRIEWLLRACDEGFDYVDLELAASESIDIVRERGVGLILSYHDFFGTSPITRLEGILDEMLEFKPDICKIIGTVRAEDDNLTYLKFIKLAQRKAKIVSFGMGERSLISRVFSPLIGGEYTYASAEEGEETAQGQIPIKMLRELYELLEV